MHGLEWRPGKGLFAVQVEWTEAAKSAIQADEYRYISPVFTYAPKTGEVISLYNAALTNVPALDGMESAVAHSLQPADDALKEMSAQLEALKASILCKDEAHESLKRRIEADEVERIVDGYVGTGKLCPAERDAALTLARHDITAVQKILDARPSFFVMQSDECNTAHHAGAHGKYPANLNPDDVRICELTGRSPEEFAALKVKYSTDDNPFHI
ncbi:hypothetical protein AGMMS49543_28660 [Betaproteobacteria bacterium]|nr:hypothetical protein AGMMS49543_28660 [Betaproteobacteria bacterium]GHU25432.1 hypothetical protein AGMMS50243_29240 [Betaproteobacteria bacterium]